MPRLKSAISPIVGVVRSTAGDTTIVGSHSQFQPQEYVLNTADPTIAVRLMCADRGRAKFNSRMGSIAAAFRADLPAPLGLVGMTEVPDSVECPESVSGAECAARAFSVHFGGQTPWSKHEQLGAVLGAEWDHKGAEAWELGKDSISHLGNRSTRHLLETLAVHRTTHWRQRFYVTHLSHGDQGEQRRDQARRLIDLVRERANLNELSPIVVGDFNSGVDSHVGEIMQKHFHLIQTSGIDHIWIGKKATFIGARGRFVSDDVSIVDLMGLQLTHHNSPRTNIKVEAFDETGWNFKVAVKTGGRDYAGTDAKVYITLIGDEASTQEFRLDTMNHDDFERGNTDSFLGTTYHLGELTAVRVRHDNSSDNAGWYLENVVVTDCASGRKWTFACNRWLSTDKGGIDFHFPLTGTS